MSDAFEVGELVIANGAYIYEVLSIESDGHLRLCYVARRRLDGSFVVPIGAGGAYYASGSHFRHFKVNNRELFDLILTLG